MDIVDTAGQDDFRGLMDSWIRNSDDPTSLQEIESIIKLARKHKETEPEVPGNPFVPAVIVGCKCDIEQDVKGVSTDRGESFAKKQLFIDTEPNNDVPYFFETSAKKKINVDEAFQAVVRQHLRKMKFVDKQLLVKNSTSKKKKKKFFFGSVSGGDEVEDE